MPNSSTLEQAYGLAEIGIPVMPYKVSFNAKEGKYAKLPLTPHAYQDASSDPEAIDRMNWPDATHVGVVAGRGGYVVFDIDDGGAGTGKALVGLLGAYAAVTKSITPDRFHVWYRYEGADLKGGHWALPEGGGGEIFHKQCGVVEYEPRQLITQLKKGEGVTLNAKAVNALRVKPSLRGAWTAGNRNINLNKAAFAAGKAGQEGRADEAMKKAIGAGLPIDEAQAVRKRAYAEGQAARNAGRDSRGLPPFTHTDLAAALEDMGLEMRRNERRGGAMEFRPEDPAMRRTELDGWHEVDEDHLERLRARITAEAREGARIVTAHWNEAFGALRDERRVDPFQAWLEDLPDWDQTERLSFMLHDLLGAEDSNLAGHISRSIPLAVVWRTFKPGFKHDEMPVLIGAQGVGKSSFCRHLFPAAYQDEWFGDNLNLAANSKERVEATLGKVVVEASELTGMRKAETESLKAYLSAQTDHVRLAYRRDPQTIKRRFLIIGTSNDAGNGVLPNDPTGLRRFLPVEVYGHDGGVKGLVAALGRDREQIWAEALDAFRRGEMAYVRTAELQGAAASAAERYRTKNAPLEDALEAALSEAAMSAPFTLANLIERVKGGGFENADRFDRYIIGELKRRGYRREKMRMGGAPCNVWVQKSVPPKLL